MSNLTSKRVTPHILRHRCHEVARACRLLICADGGGSNGYRTRQWKTALTALAARTS
jgi:hypothetical protein